MQNDDARQTILTAIRRNLAASQPFDAVHREHRTLRQNAESLAEEISFVENFPIVSPESTPADLIENFRENLESVGGRVLFAAEENEAAEKIRAIIESKNSRKIAVSDSALIEKIKSSLRTDAQILENASAGELFDCDIGITGAQFGIAETGTLVLESEKEFSRLTSLVPPVHVCLLEAKNIRRTLGETLEILQTELSRAVTFITGPSRTSDIELTLAIGVHGPAELFVIVIEKE